MCDTMIPPSPLDDRYTADHAWSRYKRIMRFMALFAFSVALVVCYVLYKQFGLVSIHFYVATALGVMFTILLTAALMGLIFLSHGTGHDESIVDPLADEDDRN